MLSPMTTCNSGPSLASSFTRIHHAKVRESHRELDSPAHFVGIVVLTDDMFRRTYNGQVAYL